jgi:hypothetical protein
VRRACDYACVFTGRVAEHLHHVTGGGADGAYLDVDLVLPLGVVLHNREHQSWGPRFKEMVDGDRNVLSLRRSGSLHVHVGEHHQDGYVAFPAFYVVQHGLMLHRIADDLERDS